MKRVAANATPAATASVNNKARKSIKNGQDSLSARFLCSEHARQDEVKLFFYPSNAGRSAA